MPPAARSEPHGSETASSSGEEIERLATDLGRLLSRFHVEQASVLIDLPGIGLYDQMIKGLAVLFDRAKAWFRKPPPDEVGEPVERR